MAASIKINEVNGCWIYGTVNYSIAKREIQFELKAAEDKIMKLYIFNALNEIVCQYERGWAIGLKPSDTVPIYGNTALSIFKSIKSILNSIPK